MNTETIQSIVSKVDLKDSKTVETAVKRLMESAVNLSAGAKVAVVDDPTYSMAGLQGTIKGPSAKGSGYVDVEFANGSVMPLQSDLLIPL